MDFNTIISHDDLAFISLPVEGLCAGYYFVEIENVHGCINTYGVEILDCQEEFEFDFISELPGGCNEEDGYINSGPVGWGGSISGAVPPYDIEWSTGDTYSNIPSGLPGIGPVGNGLYSVTVTDANGCRDVGQYSLFTDAAIEALIFDDPGDIIHSCEGMSNGRAEVFAQNVNGCCEDFNYLWSSGETTMIATNLLAGENCVTITDPDSGCSARKCVFIPEVQIISFNPSWITSPICPNDNDPETGEIFNTGELIYTGQGGNEPFEINWDNTSSSAWSQDNLGTGDYSVTVTSHCHPTELFDFNIAVHQMDINQNIKHPCAASNNGSILIQTVEGAIGDIAYLWSTGETTNMIENLAPGVYSVTVTDETGCENSEEWPLEAQQPLEEIFNSLSDAAYTGKRIITELGAGGLPENCKSLMCCEFDFDDYCQEGIASPGPGFPFDFTTTINNGVCTFTGGCNGSNDIVAIGAASSPIVELTSDNKCRSFTRCWAIGEGLVEVENGEHLQMVLSPPDGGFETIEDPFFVYNNGEGTGECTKSTFCFGQLVLHEDILCSELEDEGVEIDTDPDEDEIAEDPDCIDGVEIVEYDSGCDIAHYCNIGGKTVRTAWIDGDNVQACRWQDFVIISICIVIIAKLF